MILGGGDHVYQLPYLRLERGIVKDVQEVDVVWLGAEVLLDEVVDRALDHVGVVDSDQVHALDAVVTRLSTAGD